MTKFCSSFSTHNGGALMLAEEGGALNIQLLLLPMHEKFKQVEREQLISLVSSHLARYHIIIIITVFIHIRELNVM
jgi:hypothetical protein